MTRNAEQQLPVIQVLTLRANPDTVAYSTLLDNCTFHTSTKKSTRTRMTRAAPGVTTPYIEIAVPHCRHPKLKC
jgi:hypothetical protein